MATKLKLTDLRAAKLARRTSPALSLPATANPAAATSTLAARSTGRQIASVSVYEPDRARIRAIQRAVEEAGGGRLDDSKAIRLALRAVEANGPALLTALAAMKADDGRRRSK